MSNRINFTLTFLFVCCSNNVVTSSLLNETGQEPWISFISPTQSVEIDTKLELECKLENHSGEWSIGWLKLGPNKDPVLISVDQNIFTPESRIKVNQTPSIYKLTIENVKQTDQGIYQCKILGILESTKLVAASVEVRVVQKGSSSPDIKETISECGLENELKIKILKEQLKEEEQKGMRGTKEHEIQMDILTLQKTYWTLKNKNEQNSTD